MIREIVFDTETTGLRYQEGDRLTELGGIELINFVPTGRVFHSYLNPGRELSDESAKITGLTYSMLKDKPDFADVVAKLLEFFGDAKLVMHNANFDVGFLNNELAICGLKKLELEVIDTLPLARRTHPGLRGYSLDSLCKFFSIDNTNREYHGALLDARLLSIVYLKLLKKDQITLEFDSKNTAMHYSNALHSKNVTPIEVSAEEQAQHNKLVSKLKDATWNNY